MQMTCRLCQRLRGGHPPPSFFVWRGNIGVREFEEWTKWESVVMSEHEEEELGRVWKLLEEASGAYDASCRMAAEEM